jgi:hypothetical protein
MIDERQITIRKLRLDELGKEGGGNPNHDEKGRFAEAENASSNADVDSRYAAHMSVVACKSGKLTDRTTAATALNIAATSHLHAADLHEKLGHITQANDHRTYAAAYKKKAEEMSV